MADGNLPGMERGKLIILNGGSSAGKTSLGEALQDVLGETWLLLGIDLFWGALPPKQLDLEKVDPEYYSWKDEIIDGREHFRIIPGRKLDQAMYARYRAIKAYLDCGLNVIADDVIWKREWLIDMLEVLKPYSVIFIGVKVSDEEGERRENIRGNRHAGWNRGSALAAHRDAIYDLEIDTTGVSPEASALKIKKSIEAGLVPTAFDRLRAKFSIGG